MMRNSPKICLLVIAGSSSMILPAAIAGETSTLAVQRGYDLILKGSYENAIAVLIEDLRYRPGNFFARRYLSFAFHQIGMSTKAAQQMEIVVRRDPGNANDLALLGDMYLQCGDNPRAIAAFKGCLSIDCDHQLARCGLPRALFNAGDSIKARFICVEELKTCRQTNIRKQLMQILSKLQKAAPEGPRDARG